MIRKAFKYFLSVGRTPKIMQNIFNRNSVTILTYHSIISEPLQFGDWCFLTTEKFESQISYITKHFDIIHLSQAVRHLKNKSINKPTMVITFDDGFQNNYTYAFPILKKFNAPATIFLSTNYIGTNKTLWFTRLIRALELTVKKELIWNNQTYPLNTLIQKRTCSEDLQNFLKELPMIELDNALDEIIKRLNPKLDVNEVSEGPFKMLSLNDIKVMVNSKLIQFGAHTTDHAILSKLDYAEKVSQISESIKKTEQLQQQPCHYFAYPNGRNIDYDLDSLVILKENGIKAALSMVSGPNTINTHLLELHRYGIGSNTSLLKFKQMVHNIA